MILTIVLMAWALLSTGPVPEGEEAARPPGILDYIRTLAGDERPWARPIETVDMELMEELGRSGWASFRAADWWVGLEEDER